MGAAHSLPREEALLQVCRRCFLLESITKWLSEAEDIRCDILETADSFLEEVYLVLLNAKKEAAVKHAAEGQGVSQSSR